MSASGLVFAALKRPQERLMGRLDSTCSQKIIIIFIYETASSIPSLSLSLPPSLPPHCDRLFSWSMNYKS